MSQETFLPPEAIDQMSKDFEDIKPVISESQLRELCSGDPDLESLLESFISYSLRYAQDVWSMQKFINDGRLESEEDAEEYAAMDAARSRLHNALIDSIAILSRALARAGKDNEWVRELINGTTLDRSACGSLALLLVYQRVIDK